MLRALTPWSCFHSTNWSRWDNVSKSWVAIEPRNFWSRDHNQPLAVVQQNASELSCWTVPAKKVLLITYSAIIGCIRKSVSLLNALIAKATTEHPAFKMIWKLLLSYNTRLGKVMNTWLFFFVVFVALAWVIIEVGFIGHNNYEEIRYICKQFGHRRRAGKKNRQTGKQINLRLSQDRK